MGAHLPPGTRVLGRNGPTGPRLAEGFPSLKHCCIGEQMTSRCSQDCEGRVKINLGVTATPFPLGLSTVPLGSSAGLGSGWGAPTLVPMVFLFSFCVFPHGQGLCQP